MFTKRSVVVAGIGAVLTCTTAIGGAAAESATVLDLQLNEAKGAVTAKDSSGMGHDGAIGSHVLMNGQSAYFDRHAPGEGIAYGFEHVIAIPDAADGSLDPGTSDFSVEIRYRTKENFGNVIQKGQSRTVGGQVKFQQPKGKMSCMFKTPQGTATAGSGTTPLNDSQWHTVRCDRTQSSVTMYVDGVRTGRSNNATGTLDNKKPWTIGGKTECDAVNVTCDYFSGDIDYVRMTKGDDGSSSGDTTPPAVTTTSPAADATGAPRGGNVTASFSEPVEGVSGTTMVLRKASTGVKFGAAVDYSASSRTATLNPNVTNLPRNTKFNVTLTSGVKDAAGNSLAPTTWSFTTAS